MHKHANSDDEVEVRIDDQEEDESKLISIESVDSNGAGESSTPVSQTNAANINPNSKQSVV